MSEEEYDMLFKIVLIGDSFVGKTNILNKYLKNTFNPDSKATVGVEFGSKSFNINDKTIKAQIWDTAGQERYHSITKAYYKGAKGAFLVYDITRKETFDSIDKWIPELQVNGSKDISILLIGNKNDLEDKRKVTQDEAEQKAKNFKVGFMETSAKSGDNLDKAFETLVHSIFDSSKRKAEKNEKVENKEEKGIEIDTKINKKKKKQEGGCC